MRRLLMTFAIAALMILPAVVFLAHPKSPLMEPVIIDRTMDCPVTHASETQKQMDEMMSGIEKEMGTMMSEMQAAINDSGDPALKKRLQKVHGDMAGLLTNIQVHMDIIDWGLTDEKPIAAAAPTGVHAPVTGISQPDYSTP